jgi:hypothetical protein
MSGDQITEYVGAAGVKSSQRTHHRLSTPLPGDVIEWPNGTFGRVESLHDPKGSWAREGEVYACCELGSAFLSWSPATGRASVTISGGPFIRVTIADLKATMTTRTVRFWNWGENSMGAGQGVDYHLARPVFRYIGDSDHYRIR